jgi:hypothetical protein
MYITIIIMYYRSLSYVSYDHLSYFDNSLGSTGLCAICTYVSNLLRGILLTLMDVTAIYLALLHWDIHLYATLTVPFNSTIHFSREIPDMHKPEMKSPQV